MKNIQYMKNYQKEIDMKKTGRIINEKIINSGLTYEELAELLGLATPRVIYEWIKGNKKPKTEHLINLAFIFRVNIMDLIALR